MQARVTTRGGTVERVDGNVCWVRLDPVGCDGCRCGLGSGTGLHQFVVPAALAAPGRGARVGVELASPRLRQMVFAVFGIPVASLLSAAVIAETWRAGFGPTGALLGLCLGLAAAWLAALHIERSDRCRPALVG